jgi:hypothetical protein
LERVGETTARMQEVEQRMEQLPKRIKTTIYIPTLSLKGEGAGTCVDTYGYRGSSIGLLDNAVIGYYCNSEFLDYLHLKYN